MNDTSEDHEHLTGDLTFIGQEIRHPGRNIAGMPRHVRVGDFLGTYLGCQSGCGAWGDGIHSNAVPPELPCPDLG